MPDTELPPQYLACEDGAMIAYRHTPGKGPGVMFLTGFKSDMQGGKALALESHCIERGQAFTRFDYFGHGESSGAFEDGTIGRWTADAVKVLDDVTGGPQVLVGSSMGGWIMLLTALARPDRIAALVGIAAAPDFTHDLIPQRLTGEQIAQLSREGYCDIPNCYDDQESYRIRQSFLDEGNQHLLLSGEIAIDIPVRLIQGIRDEDVPWQRAQEIMTRLQSDDVEIQYVKTGDHRLSSDADLNRLRRTVDTLLEEI